MTPEDRERIEEIRERLARGRVAYNSPEEIITDAMWLLDLVERQEAELERALRAGREPRTVFYNQLKHDSGCFYEPNPGWECVATCPVKLAQGALPL